MEARGGEPRVTCTARSSEAIAPSLACLASDRTCIGEVSLEGNGRRARALDCTGFLFNSLSVVSHREPWVDF